MHWIHLGSHSPAELAFWAFVILAVIVLLFMFFWWRRRADKADSGDFAALVSKGNVAQALEAQERPAIADAAAAWTDTQETMQKAKTAAERALALMWCLLSGLGATMTGLMTLVALTGGWAALDLGFLIVLAVCLVCVWFTRVQWRDFKGVN